MNHLFEGSAMVWHHLCQERSGDGGRGAASRTTAKRGDEVQDEREVVLQDSVGTSIVLQLAPFPFQLRCLQTYLGDERVPPVLVCRARVVPLPFPHVQDNCLQFWQLARPYRAMLPQKRLELWAAEGRVRLGSGLHLLHPLSPFS